MTGWEWEYIDREMDLPRLYAMLRHWRKNPPLRDMVQAWMGIKPEEEAPASDKSEASNTRADLDQFIQSFSAAGGSVG